MEFLEKLKRLEVIRKRLRLPIYKLASEIGMSKRSLYGWRKKTKEPKQSYTTMGLIDDFLKKHGEM